MTKTELIMAMAERSGVSNKDASNFLDAFVDIVSDELKAGRSVQLIGFGTFDVVEKAEREGRNPKTNEKMIIPACKVPKFKPGKALKDLIKG